MKEKHTQRPNIVITDGDYFMPGFLEEKTPLLFELGNVLKVQTQNEEELIEALSIADVAMIRRVKMTRKVFEFCPRLLGLAKMGAGVENIDIPAATDHGVIIANSPAVTIAVAEAALLLMMATVKPLLVMVDCVKKGEPPPPEARGNELFGKTLGIVGFGQIGSHLGQIGKGMGMEVLVYDPYVEKTAGLKFVELEKLLRESDFISLHCPLVPETRHLIGKKELSIMKSTAVLINTSRGGVVDEMALVEALLSGRLRAAGLDVVEDEPIKPDNPLLQLPNVVLTPHALARTWESIDKVSDICQNAIEMILQGRMPKTVLNPKVERKSSPFTK